MSLSLSFLRTSRPALRLIRRPLHSSPDLDLPQFLRDVARVSPVPKRLSVLVDLLRLRGKEEEVLVLDNPISKRRGLNPFLIPVAVDKNHKEVAVGFLRWPTQKSEGELQVVRCSGEGMITLLSLGVDQYCHRLVVEMDFFGHPHATEAVDLLNRDGQMYQVGDYVPMLKSGKFPALTTEDLRLVLDRYLLTKVGQFPDCFERLAEDFLKKGNDVSALVTCERAVSVFYGWGHPISFHSDVLSRLGGRDRESVDTARSAMQMPKWTLARDKEGLQKIVKQAGFSSLEILGEMHAFRSADSREKDRQEKNLSEVQLALDQAAHLMDAVALGTGTVTSGDWESVREDIATKYDLGGYPEMSAFIRAV